jgi:uncharacterized protein YciI
MSFLVIMRPAREGVEQETAMLEAHWEYLRALHVDGKLVVAGPSWLPEDPFGVGIFDLEDRAEVEALVAADPAVTSGALRPEIRPLRIVTR